ncbi:MAG: oxidoreductase, partial [Luminiphilus sp.]|nr:oxidoreductase [Luminiphilus sp.]
MISGVGPGLGQTLAKMAAQEGASVVLGARSQDFLDAVAEEIRTAGG